jgi:tRNA pseudouridine55 synthase
VDGLLVIDKPAGPTSHDVVARARRLLRERRIGHTGTLDPMATGVLPLVVGRAARLARFLSAGDKSYEAVIRLGFATDTGDATGTPMAATGVPLPPRAAIEAALDSFRGSFLQQPPAFSAKKIGGRPSYALARAVTSGPAAAAVRPAPVAVTVHRLDVLSVDGDALSISLDCAAGFYVRALAHDLGERLGVGAHLAALRRTRSGDYTLDDAVELDAAERDPAGAGAQLVPLSSLLPRMPLVCLTPAGVEGARHGRDLGPRDLTPDAQVPNPDSFVRLFNPGGDLVAIAEPAHGGLLHPFVVLM